MKYFPVLFIAVALGFSSVSLAQKAPAKPVVAGVVNGKATFLPKPFYPAEARAIKLSGEVKVQVLIDEQGNVVSAKAESGDILLRGPAETAARASKFSPTTLSGQPVKVTGVIVYRFVAEDGGNLKYLQIGVVFSFLQNADEEMIKEIGLDFSDAPKMEAGDLPPEIEELKPKFDKFFATAGMERKKAAAALAGEIAGRLAGERKWLFEVGIEIFPILFDLKQAAESMEAGKAFPNEAEFRRKLFRIKELWLSAPQDAPSVLLSRIASIGAYSGDPAIAAPEKMKAVAEQVGFIFDYVDTGK